MPKRTATFTNLHVDEDGAIHVLLGKEERVFQDMAHMNRWVDEQLGVNTMIALSIALLKERGGKGAFAALKGKTVTLDLTSNNWGTVG